MPEDDVSAELAVDLTAFDSRGPDFPARPELRRRPLDGRVVLRVRVDLAYAQPPIWRRLDLRSDLTLDVVHQVLQAAFGWTDSHLHRFSLGGGPFDATSQLFLCPFDVGEPEDDGLAASEVRLDETLQQPGDVLQYIYDYGDSWELTLRVEEVLPAAADAPAATCVDGARAAPPDDSGGMTDAESLAEVLDDPVHFDLAEVNQALTDPYFVVREHGVDPRLVQLMNRLRYASVGDDLAARLLALVSLPTVPEPEELTGALRAHQWFLDRAQGDGIELTAAGYLKPADVEAASAVVPAMSDWIGKNNRESQSRPLLVFRRSLQSMGLLRNTKGRLLLTKAGAAALSDPGKLWDHVASRLVPAGDDTFEVQATLLLLAHVGAAPDRDLPRGVIARTLAELGWRHSDGRPLGGYEIYRLTAFEVLRNVTDRPIPRHDRDRFSPAAGALARAALRSQTR